MMAAGKRILWLAKHFRTITKHQTYCSPPPAPQPCVIMIWGPDNLFALMTCWPHVLQSCNHHLKSSQLASPESHWRSLQGGLQSCSGLPIVSGGWVKELPAERFQLCAHRELFHLLPEIRESWNPGRIFSPWAQRHRGEVRRTGCLRSVG